MKRCHCFSTVLCISLLLTSAIALAYPLRFMGTRTGAPSESTCSSCHGNLNIGSGKAVLTASKTQYLVGDTVIVTLAVSQTGQDRWGFEVTVLDSLTHPCGSLTSNDMMNTQDTTLAASGRQYIWHSSTGTCAGTMDSTKWHFRWVATAGTTGPVTFYACGMAANNDNSNNGDYPYTTTFTLKPASLVSCCVGTRGNVNNAGIIDLSDLSLLIAYLTATIKPTLPCPTAANVNAAGIIDLSDLSLLIAYLTATSKPTLPTCP